MGYSKKLKVLKIYSKGLTSKNKQKQKKSYKRVEIIIKRI